MINTILILMTTVTIAATPIDNLKRPGLTIPQGQIESNLNYRAKGKAGERGAWQQIRRYVKDDYIADELLKSKRPYVYAAIAKVESDYRPQILGDNGRSFGLFQIQQEIHGEFNDKISDQIAKCESILEPLIQRYGLKKALERYNGRGKKAQTYAKLVLKTHRKIKLA